MTENTSDATPKTDEKTKSTNSSRPVRTNRSADTAVLVVDDDPQVLELYREFLEADYEVRLAGDGRQALERLDDTIDVVLLDRRMPGLSGDEVLQTIRDGRYLCRVVMVTAVAPDFDVVDLGFDDYVEKPVTKEDLLAVVELMENRAVYDRHIREWLSFLSTRSVLERSMTSEELGASAEFAQLEDEIDELQARADESLETLSSDQLEVLFRDFEGRPVDKE